MLHKNEFAQNRLLENYKLLVSAFQEMGIKLEPLNDKGICAGLSLNYLLYAKQDQREEFQLYLNVIASLDKQSIDKLIQQCKEAKKNNKNFWRLKIEAKVGKETLSFSFEKLIRFMEGVQAAHKSQFFKDIGANWDKDVTFVCKQQDLAQCLREAHIKNGEYMAFSLGAHLFSLEKKGGFFYLFEPNSIKKVLQTLPLKDEEALADAIIKNISDSNFFGSSNFNNIALAISFLSYGDKNRQVDDAIQQYQTNTKIAYEELKSLIDQYNLGCISCVDFTTAMLDQIEMIKTDEVKTNEVLIEFENTLKAYLSSQQLDQDNLLDSNREMINQTAYSFDISWLFLAAYSNQINLVKKLIAQGADLNHSTKTGLTPTYIAAQNGHVDVIKLLADAKADLNKPEKEDGVTPIWIASQNGHADVVKVLADAKADLNRPNKNGATPISIASQNGHADVIKILVDANADLNCSNKNGSTPLYIAAQNGHADAVKVLVNAKTDLNCPNKNGVTPTYIAAQKGHVDVIKVLVDAKADLNLPNKNGTTPLYIAAQVGRADVIKVLADANADLNYPVKNGATPALIAAQNGHDDAIKVLVDAKADLNLPNKNGITPLFAAVINGHINVVKILIQNNVDANLPCVIDQTILSDLAKQYHVENQMKDFLKTKIASGESPEHIRITPLELAETIIKNSAMTKLFIDEKDFGKEKNEKERKFKLFNVSTISDKTDINPVETVKPKNH